MVEMKMTGAPDAAIGQALALSPSQLKRELQAAQKEGLVDEVRERLLATLKKTPDVLTDIMDKPVEDLQKNSRGYKLKLDAANSLNAGMGAYRPESHKTTETKWTLESIAAERAGGSIASNPDPPKRIAFQPETLDGEIIPTPAEEV